MKKVTRILCTLLSLIMLITPLAFADNEKIDIVILGTSDIHANIYGFSYEDTKETTNNGMARLATFVENVRKENPNVVLVDNGDTYQGTILSDAIYNKKTDIHPMSKALNAMKYDSMTLGNHEFNFGIDFIKKFVSELKFPVLAANAYYAADNTPFQKPYTVVERNGVKIGILGITNPNAPRWDGEKVAALKFESIEKTAEKFVKILKEEEKADIVVIVAHAGIVPEYDQENGADGIQKILDNVKGVDAVLAGHYHAVEKGEVNGIVYAAPRNSGRDIVRFDITVKKNADGYKVVDKKVDVIEMKDVEPSKELRNLIKAEHKATINFISGSSESTENGGGIFGVATADFQPANEINAIPEGFLKDSAVADFIGEVQLKMSGADVTATAIFRNDADIKKGNITYADLFRIYKFDNTLYTVNITGKELKTYMEWSAEFYNQFKEGDLNISFNPDVPGWRYDIFKGIEYKIDLSKPVGERITDVKFKGETLKDDQILKLAVNNYRYSAGLKANKFVAANKDWESPMAIRDAIAEYVKNAKEITPKVSNNWEIIGVNTEHPLRSEIIKLVNDGFIEAPYNKALNIAELTAAGTIVDGKVVTPKEKVNTEIAVSEKSGTTVKKEEKKEEVKPAATKEFIKHVVVSGEWVNKIAMKYNVNPAEIIKINNLKNPNLIFPGDVLLIPVK